MEYYTFKNDKILKVFLSFLCLNKIVSNIGMEEKFSKKEQERFQMF